MKPGKVNLTIYKGSNFFRSFQWLTGDPSVPVDMTGYIVRAQFRSKQSSPEVLLEFSYAADNIVLADAVLGKFQMNLTAAQTTAIDFKSAVYDLEVESPGGYVIRLIEGSVTIIPEITR